MIIRAICIASSVFGPFLLMISKAPSPACTGLSPLAAGGKAWK